MFYSLTRLGDYSSKLGQDSGIPCGSAWQSSFRGQVFMVDLRGSCWAIWSNPLRTVKWHSWPLTNSDFPTDQTFHQFHDLYTELGLAPNYEWFPWRAFATGVASQQGTLTLPDTWFQSHILGLANAPIVEDQIPVDTCHDLYSTFHLEYPLRYFRRFYLVN